MSETLPVGERLPYERVWVGKNKAKAIIASTHPKAAIIFSLVTWVLASMTLSGLPGYSVSIALVLGMACVQASIGMFNEIFDWKQDKVFKPWRAIPAGMISPGAATVIASVFLMAGLLFAAFISWDTMILILLGAGMGILYSAIFKRTIFSWLPYVINYPSFPVWVMVALNRFDPLILVIYPMAFPFALGIHMCNQMRDYDEDSALGIQSFVQHLGKPRAIKLCYAILLFSPLPFLMVTGFFNPDEVVYVPVLIAILHWSLTVPLFFRSAYDPRTFRLLFTRLQITGSLMLLAWYWIFIRSRI